MSYQPTIEELLRQNEELVRRLDRIGVNAASASDGLHDDPVTRAMTSGRFFEALMTNLPDTLVVIYNHRLRVDHLHGDPGLIARTTLDDLIGCPLSELLPDRPASLRLQTLAQAALRGKRAADEIAGKDCTWFARCCAIGIAHQQAMLLISDHSLAHQDHLHTVAQDRLATIGTLTGGIAHEFNNLITAISGHAELCLRQPHLDEHGRRHLQIIMASCERSTRLASNLLAAVRGEARTPTGTCDLIEVVANAIELFQVNAHTRHVEVIWQRPEGSTWVRGSPTHMGQVLLNLLSNALKAVDDIPAGRITVQLIGDEHHLRCEVSDNGCGIPAEDQAKVFQTFYSSWAKPRNHGGTGGSTGSSTGGNGYRGTGLGLALCQQMMTDAGGSLTVRSQVGLGSTFIMTTQCCQMPLAAPLVATPTPSDDNGQQLGSLLVVDDETHIRTLVCDHLTDEGYAVREAANGKEAMDMLLTEPADLLLLDWRMPVLDGAGVLRQLDELGSYLPVILCSANCDEIPADVSAMVRARVHKPFRLDDLSRTIAAVLARVE